jgi:hypothetical protein
VEEAFMDISVDQTSVARRPRRVAASRPSETSESAVQVPPQAIAARAYELFLERGGEHGGDVDDWLRAERELSQAGVDASIVRGETTQRDMN